jgi:hypothetical protein
LCPEGRDDEIDDRQEVEDEKPVAEAQRRWRRSRVEFAQALAEGAAAAMPPFAARHRGHRAATLARACDEEPSRNGSREFEAHRSGREP